jgi:hypothetical protein
MNISDIPEWLHAVLLDSQYSKRQVPIKVNGLCCDYAIFVKINEISEISSKMEDVGISQDGEACKGQSLLIEINVGFDNLTFPSIIVQCSECQWSVRSKQIS